MGEPRAATTRQQWMLLVGMALSMSLWFIDDTAVTVALPTIQRYFDISGTAVQWTLTAYLLAAAAGVAGAGRLADIFGRRRVFMVGVGTFVVSSILCGLAFDDWWLIVARVFQGGGAALMGPAASALVTTTFTIADAFSYGFAYGMRFGVIVAAGAAVLGLLLLRRPRQQARWVADDRAAQIDRPIPRYR